MKRGSKYKAKPTVVDGIRFHSQKEARRYAELKLLERAGEIHLLELQPRYELRVPLPSGHPKAGQAFKCVGAYIADFQYATHPDYPARGKCVVEDVKGFKTPLYRWKKKHVEAQYGIEIREV